MVLFNNLLDMIRHTIIKGGDNENDLISELPVKGGSKSAACCPKFTTGMAFFQSTGTVLVAGKRTARTLGESDDFYPHRLFHGSSTASETF